MARFTKFTPLKKAKFLEMLAEYPNVTAAEARCRALDMPPPITR